MALEDSARRSRTRQGDRHGLCSFFNNHPFRLLQGRACRAVCDRAEWRWLFSWLLSYKLDDAPIAYRAFLVIQNVRVHLLNPRPLPRAGTIDPRMPRKPR
jgi:hypothetical protein